MRKILFILTAILTLTGASALVSPAPALATTTLCTPPKFQHASVNGGREMMQTNEFGAEQTPMCISNDGLGSDLTITQAAYTDTGKVQAYPSLFKGCHWGLCSSSTYNYFPQQVSAIHPGDYTYGASNSLVPGAYTGDFAWDIWINQDSQAGQPGHTCNSCGTSSELMVWTRYSGTQPAGSRVASGISIGGTTYDVWHGGNTTSYVANPQTDSLSFDLAAILGDMSGRGYTSTSYYMIDAEYGLEPRALTIPPTTNEAGFIMSVCNNLTGTC